MMNLTDVLSGKIKLVDAVDYAEAKIIEQGKAAVNDGRCVYRAEDGSKCAIGHIITDEEINAIVNDLQSREDGYTYSTDTLGGISSLLFAGQNVIKQSINERYYKVKNVLAELQNAHDDYHDAENYIEEFKKSMAEFRQKNKFELRDL